MLMVLLILMVMKTLASNLWHDAIIYLFFMFLLSSVDFKKPSVNLPVSICYCDCSAIIIVALFPAKLKEKKYSKENIFWRDVTGREKEKQAGQHSLNVSFPDYFSLLLLCSYIKGNATFVLDWTRLSDNLLSHVAFMYGFSESSWSSIILLFSCCPPSLPYLPLMSLRSSHHTFCFCICRGNNSDGRRDLPADLRIIHHSLFVATVRSGWVSSNLHM